MWVGRHAVRVNGHPVPYPRNSWPEAARAGRLLTAAVGSDVPVRPVPVFLTGTLIPNVTIKQLPDDVVVLDRADVPGVVTRAPRRATGRRVTAIYAARRSTT